MKILVTGATGFVGRHVVARLLRTEHDILATSTGKGDFRLPDHPRLSYAPCDLNAPDAETPVRFAQADAVVHLAWEGLPNYRELFHLERNLWSQYGFLKRLVESGVRNITVAGTCFEYGKQEGCLSEDLPARPNTAYATAKNSLREFLDVLKTKFPFEFKWIRLFYMHGEGQSRTSILEQLKEALRRGDKTFNMSGGEQLRDYLPIEAVADRIVRIALQHEIQGIVNCGSGAPISIRSFVERFLEESSATEKIRLNLGHYSYPPHEPMAFWADMSKYQSLLERNATKSTSHENTICPDSDD